MTRQVPRYLGAKPEPELPDFETYGDGCSAWPDTWLGVSIRWFCGRHDYTYRTGGGDTFWQKARLRLVGDAALAWGVGTVKPNKWWHRPLHWANGIAMFGGVRVGGIKAFRAYGLADFHWGRGDYDVEENPDLGGAGNA